MNSTKKCNETMNCSKNKLNSNKNKLNSKKKNVVFFSQCQMQPTVHDNMMKKTTTCSCDKLWQNL